MRKIALVAAATVTVVSTPALANGPYIGIGVTHENVAGASGFEGLGLSGIGGTVFAGYSLPVNESVFVGVEANFDLSSAKVGDKTAGTEADHAFGISGRLGTNLNDKTSLYGRVGYQRGRLGFTANNVTVTKSFDGLRLGAGVQTALTLSDVSMINFCRAGLAAMVGDGLDYLFANEEEAQVWCGSTDLEVILPQLRKLARTVCLTRGPKGCIVLQGSEMANVPAVPTKAVDTNGAGDMFAGAFLYGVTHGMTQAEAAALANRAAAAVVSQHGNRLTREQMQALRQA